MLLTNRLMLPKTKQTAYAICVSYCIVYWVRYMKIHVWKWNENDDWWQQGGSQNKTNMQFMHVHHFNIIVWFIPLLLQITNHATLRQLRRANCSLPVSGIQNQRIRFMKKYCSEIWPKYAPFNAFLLFVAQACVDNKKMSGGMPPFYLLPTIVVNYVPEYMNFVAVPVVGNVPRERYATISTLPLLQWFEI